MNSVLSRGWNWCRRFRKRCGYGVHSPSDFFLIAFVVYESLPYYAYGKLKELRRLRVAGLGHREKVDRLLFRLVNYLQPSFMLELCTGVGISTIYMAEANKKMKVVTCSGEDCFDASLLTGFRSDIVFEPGGMDKFVSLLETSEQKPDLIHISETCCYKSAFEAVLPYVSSKTCVIVSKPYADKEKKKWWKGIVEDPRTGVTFDLYDIGLVFFDAKRVKEHRVVNFL